MSIQILSPQTGDTFTTTDVITVSGTNGPPDSVTANLVGGADSPAAPDDSGDDLGWTTTVGPLSPAGTYKITATKGGKAASVFITVQ